MTPVQKRYALIAAAVGTLALIWLAPDSSSEPTKNKSTAARAPAEMAAFAASDSLAAKRRQAAASGPLNIPVFNGERDGIAMTKALFGKASWFVAPPPPPPAPPPPPPPPVKPTAPPLPYTFIGRYVEDGKPQILLAKGSRVIAAGVNEIIDSNYKVVRIDQNAAVLMYIPLQIPQTVAIGSSQ